MLGDKYSAGGNIATHEVDGTGNVVNSHNVNIQNANITVIGDDSRFGAAFIEAARSGMKSKSQLEVLVCCPDELTDGPVKTFCDNLIGQILQVLEGRFVVRRLTLADFQGSPKFIHEEQVNVFREHTCRAAIIIADSYSSFFQCAILLDILKSTPKKWIYFLANPEVIQGESYFCGGPRRQCEILGYQMKIIETGWDEEEKIQVVCEHLTFVGNVI